MDEISILEGLSTLRHLRDGVDPEDAREVAALGRKWATRYVRRASAQDTAQSGPS